MKFASLLGAMAAIATLGAASVASADITVGSNDSGNCYPFNCNDSGTSTGQSIDYQQAYSASAFSGPVTINSVTFTQWDTSAQTVLNGDYAITFGTVATGVGASYPIAATNIQSFFSGHLGGAYSGTFTINGAGYNYDPANGDLVMEVVASNQDVVPNGEGNGYFQADYTGKVTTRAYLLSPSMQASGTGALVTTFGTSAAPEPATWALMTLAVGGMGGALRVRRRRVAAAA